MTSARLRRSVTDQRKPHPLTVREAMFRCARALRGHYHRGADERSGHSTRRPCFPRTLRPTVPLGTVQAHDTVSLTTVAAVRRAPRTHSPRVPDASHPLTHASLRPSPSISGNHHPALRVYKRSTCRRSYGTCLPVTGLFHSA